MAVYDQGYRPYSGPLTPEWTRFLVLPRYAARSVLRSRLFAGFLAALGMFTLFCCLAIYGAHNLPQIPGLELPIDLGAALDENFGALYLRVFLFLESILGGFMIAIVVGPGLLSADLANGALPLYLSRPISRAEYVLGKAAVLAGLLSLVTFLPGLLLFGLEAYYAGWDWMARHGRLALGITAGSLVWIAVLTLFSLAVSALVRWRSLGRAALFGLFVLPGGFGAAIDGLFGTSWGGLLSPTKVITRVWVHLFDPALEPNRLSVPAAWASLAAMLALALLVLRRKLRAYEVVR
ncbi:MAG: ABC transporter permease [Acidobacteria bacterium]|nr:MAG: ABC transporter permease [Acidobacteriota bacterium]